ncbi:hypothetical protein [Alicyclobacillus sp.]|uniref:hypothetical protein n=1 Tax=Alicyclobacillus sp. TaxID=61169 RepID=UPI0025C062C6|nr:hypothetical protein [Alicyclobacillus sp.]MCL6516037.1 hypothetical protein [Alicyclobacillus sp.]
MNERRPAGANEFRPAPLRPELVERIRDLERQLSAEAAEEIVLVAYHHDSAKPRP